MADIILYSTKCPKCIVLEKKLKNKQINFSEINDVDIMKKKGFLSSPILEVDGKIMDFIEANSWVNTVK